MMGKDAGFDGTVTKHSLGAYGAVKKFQAKIPVNATIHRIPIFGGFAPYVMSRDSVPPALLIQNYPSSTYNRQCRYYQ